MNIYRFFTNRLHVFWKSRNDIISLKCSDCVCVDCMNWHILGACTIKRIQTRKNCRADFLFGSSSNHINYDDNRIETLIYTIASIFFAFFSSIHFVNWLNSDFFSQFHLSAKSNLRTALVDDQTWNNLVPLLLVSPALHDSILNCAWIFAPSYTFVITREGIYFHISTFRCCFFFIKE